MHEGTKTTLEFWEDTWRTRIRLSLPSGLDIGTRNLMRLLRQHTRPGMSLLEIGFAPGKLLSWMAKILETRVSGLDYSLTGVTTARALFKNLGLDGDLRCEDIFNTSFKSRSFDLVCSFGLIEHFDDPREIVRCHVELAKPGGTVLIVIPNYGGVYGRLQRFFDSDNLEIHNLSIMEPEQLARLAPPDQVVEAAAFLYGRFSPWLISFKKKWPLSVSQGLSLGLNAVGLIQPLDVSPLCPLIVLKMVRAR